MVEPILSDDLNAVIEILRGHTLAQETDSCKAIVFSDKFNQDADLLVTTDTLDGIGAPFCLVARWGNIRLVRIGDISMSSMKIISNWKDIPPASEPFIWQGDGSSVRIFRQRKHSIIFLLFSLCNSSFLDFCAGGGNKSFP